MMAVPERQTFLGGERASAKWEELTPHELVLASQGSPGQAEAILPLVNTQIVEARAREDTVLEREYITSRHVMLGILGLTASTRDLAVQLKSANRQREHAIFGETVDLLGRYYNAYGAEHAPFSYVALNAVAWQFVYSRTRTTDFYILESHFAEYRRLTQ